MAYEKSDQVQNIDTGSITALRELALSASNFNPIGRVVGDFTKMETLNSTFLKSKDEIFIPSRPTSVSVVGEVMTPGSILWSSRKNENDYINDAAGMTELAEKDNIFIISPNGKAYRSKGLWGSSKIMSWEYNVIPKLLALL